MMMLAFLSSADAVPATARQRALLLEGTAIRAAQAWVSPDNATPPSCLGKAERTRQRRKSGSGPAHQVIGVDAFSKCRHLVCPCCDRPWLACVDSMHHVDCPTLGYHFACKVAFSLCSGRIVTWTLLGIRVPRLVVEVPAEDGRIILQ